MKTTHSGTVGDSEAARLTYRRESHRRPCRACHPCRPCRACRPCHPCRACRPCLSGRKPLRYVPWSQASNSSWPNLGHWKQFTFSWLKGKQSLVGARRFVVLCPPKKLWTLVFPSRNPETGDTRPTVSGPRHLLRSWRQISHAWKLWMVWDPFSDPKPTKASKHAPGLFGLDSLSAGCRISLASG